jgi:1,4-dihydroxy-2-naphthoyl-CoA hydrolase
MSIHIDEEVRERVEAFIKRDEPNMAHALGIEFEKFSTHEVTATMPVHAPTKQPFGLLHGGASVALAETLASIGAWLNIDDRHQTAVGLEINANHIKAVRSGMVRGVATPIHKGAQTHVWEIRITTESGKLVCISRCTLAIIKRRD